MYAVKIEDVINNHDLIIPFDKIKGLNHQEVEVIVFPKVVPSGKKGKLKSIFNKYRGIALFSQIKDVSDWQRELRSEW